MRTLFLAVMALFAFSSYANAEIKVIKVKGEVFKNNQLLKMDDSLKIGDEIKTAPKSSALLKIESSYIYLDQNQTFKVINDKGRANINTNIDKHLIIKYFNRKNKRPDTNTVFVDDLQQDLDKFKNMFLNADYEKAVEFADQVNLPLSDIEFLYMYAISHLKLDMNAKAVQLFQKILEIKNSNYTESCYFGIFLAQLMAKNYNKAKKTVSELKSAVPKSGMIFIAEDLLKKQK